MPAASAEVRYGTAGWSYRDWEGVVYPKPKSKGFDPLEYLSGFVDTIEINSTFYRPQPARNARSWAARVAANPRFKFTCKLHRSFTHDQGTLEARAADEHRAAPEALFEAGILGAVLVQFPWSFRNNADNRRRIFELADMFGGFPLAVEVRHSSWDRPEFRRMLEELGAAYVNVDQPVIGESLAPSSHVTSRVGYVRLHGRNEKDWFRDGAGRDARYDYLYGADELLEWHGRIEEMKSRCDELYIVANNHYKGQALVNAIQLKFMDGGPLALPAPLLESYPLLQEVQR